MSPVQDLQTLGRTLCPGAMAADHPAPGTGRHEMVDRMARPLRACGVGHRRRSRGRHGIRGRMRPPLPDALER